MRPTKLELSIVCLFLVGAAILLAANHQRAKSERAITVMASPPTSRVMINTEADRQRIRAQRARARAFVRRRKTIGNRVGDESGVLIAPIPSRVPTGSSD